MFHTVLRRCSIAISRHPFCVVLVVLATALFAAPAAAHGTAERAVGITLPAVVAGSVATSLLGGGIVFAAVSRFPHSRRIVPLLVLALGGLSVTPAAAQRPVVAGLGVVAGAGVVVLARDRSITDCDTCADAALGAVTLHRGFEGVVLATVYAADAALGLLGAAILAIHAMAETAAVGSLYAATRHYAVTAVCILQVGFVVGVAVGWSVVDAVPTGVEAGLLALVGGVLLAVGGREGYHRYTGRQSAPAV